MRAVSSEVELEDAPCPCGSEAGDALVFVGRDRLHGLPGEFAVVRCLACDLVRTNPRPTRETIGFYYPSSYRLHQAPPPPAPTKPRRFARARKLASSMIDFRTKPLPENGPGHYYEVGCGNGGFLRVMQSKGWSVEGLEPGETGAESARAQGLDVVCAQLEDAPAPKKTPDLVAAWMVLEHLHDPVAGLRRLHEWTRPGAYLAASVPNVESLEFSVFKGAWYALQVPTHLYFYTPKTLAALFDSAGWTLERVFHHRNITNLVTSTGYKLEDLGVAPALAQHLIGYPSRATWQLLATYPLATVLAALGQTGRITVWARRR